MKNNDTIFALSSAPGVSGVAVVRVSGPKSLEILKELTGRKRFAARHAYLCKVNGDHVLAIYFAAKSSFTGEDSAEIHPHGSRAVLAALYESLLHLGARTAQNGEFTRRAVMNGKMNLAQAEALLDIINSETSVQKAVALRRMDARSYKEYDQWHEVLVQQLARLEFELDFSDGQDLPSGFDMGQLAGIAGKIAGRLRNSRDGRIISHGFSIAVVGAVNAGKSSLINVLSRSDAAIVSDIAGTTRDVISVKLEIGGFPVIMKDTAGLRQTVDSIEKEGIRRALQEAENADLVLHLIGGDDDDTEYSVDFKHILCVHNKADQRENRDPGRLDISCLTGEGIPQLIETIRQIMQNQWDNTQDWQFISLRHKTALDQALQALGQAQTAQDKELTAEWVRQAILCLDSITGRDGAAQAMDEVFKNFCIGK
ncbi:MAG: tRNA uridine-5-carboxymethylaminomethyl(34) synthesis GTPase MnmE [Alphaproteobacteria bacterium]|nr:tRNA uridine-5-carboxymethylaminomethyl(34) synthesis GTPase MnmE [Alphaproteobacteria bacterium]